MSLDGVIQRKLALMDDQALQLQKNLRGVTLEQFKESWLLRSMAERALQIAIELMIDIAERLLAQAGAGPAATAAEAVRKCLQLGILSAEEPYQEMVGYHNVLAYEFEQADPERTYTLATQKLSDFRLFRDEIDRWMVQAGH